MFQVPPTCRDRPEEVAGCIDDHWTINWPRAVE